MRGPCTPLGSGSVYVSWDKCRWEEPKQYSLEELEELEASMDWTSWYAEQDIHVSCLRNFFSWLEEQEESIVIIAEDISRAIEEGGDKCSENR